MKIFKDQEKPQNLLFSRKFKTTHFKKSPGITQKQREKMCKNLQEGEANDLHGDTVTSLRVMSFNPYKGPLKSHVLQKTQDEKQAV